MGDDMFRNKNQIGERIDKFITDLGFDVEYDFKIEGEEIKYYFKINSRQYRMYWTLFVSNEINDRNCMNFYLDLYETDDGLLTIDDDELNNFGKFLRIQEDEYNKREEKKEININRLADKIYKYITNLGFEVYYFILDTFSIYYKVEYDNYYWKVRASDHEPKYYNSAKDYYLFFDFNWQENDFSVNEEDLDELKMWLHEQKQQKVPNTTRCSVA